MYSSQVDTSHTNNVSVTRSTRCLDDTNLDVVIYVLYLYLYEVLGPGREDLSGQWSVWCSRLLNLP